MTKKQTQELEKKGYNRIVKMASRAEKQARIFVEKNIKINPQARVKYSL